MEKWITLSESSYGVHRGWFKDEMSYEEAVELGKADCKEYGRNYIGTYNTITIEEAVKEYEESKKV